ncbi:hypothetical protein [Planosporangium mesophilum]|uniref:Uncharacterized protein n=1 Tax=Planosporangium mesophilum TaxID=689768 RepID=A0A8J3T7W3_9ACTN|nr:hypothetical protein [Planosporangium mesophilum]NJC82134.1 hypothetical protein [Planosporangium mesophilum]GII22180.1 hypothetical protein Pme01_17770 [Planosporangium mesophilum]
MLTTRPAYGASARQRCRTPRGLALRTVPLRVKLDERNLRRAYAESGPYGLALHVRWTLLDLASHRAVNDDVPRVLVAWYRTAVAEATADARAEAEGWPCGSLLHPATA